MKQAMKYFRLSGLCGVLLGLAAVAAFRFAFFLDGEHSQDEFYHVRIALEGWKVFAAKTFPNMILSSWSECFADKELLFHLILGWIQRGVLALGLPEIPFHIPNLFFVLFLVASFVYAGMAYRVRGLWWLCILLTGAFAYFTPRLLMIRPHLLSIGLMLLSVTVFPNVRNLRDIWKGAAIGFLFAWSYSNPHFVYLTAGAFAVATLFYKRKQSFFILFSVSIGLLAGFILHPQVPNTFINWKIQCIDVPLFMLQDNPLLNLGDEMMLRPYRLYVEDPIGFLPFFLLTGYNILATVLWFRRERMACFHRERLIALMIIAAATGAGYVFIYRMVEYAWPFGLLYAGAVFPYAFRRTWLWRNGNAHACAALVAVCALTWTLMQLNSSYFEPQKPFTHLAEWFWRNERSIPPGTVIANLNWSEFPQLYYAMPQYRYLCGLDPSFGYFYKKDITLAIERFRMGGALPEPRGMMMLTGSPLVFLTERDAPLAERLYKAGYRMLYQGRDGWLFSTFNKAVPRRNVPSRRTVRP